MDETKFELEDSFEEDNEILEEEYEEDDERGNGIYILLAVFIILFLTTASLFIYYQFYLGDGQWQFSMKKRSTEAVIANKNLEKENVILSKRIDSLMLANERDTNQSDVVQVSASEGSNGELFENIYEGTVYEIQMGAFKNYDFTKYAPQLVNMNVDVEDGYNKLVIGRFTSFDDACAFRQDLKLLGLTGTFIVKKVDGQRVKFDKWCP